MNQLPQVPVRAIETSPQPERKGRRPKRPASQVYVYRYDISRPAARRKGRPGGRRVFVANYQPDSNLVAYIEQGGLGPGRYRLEWRDRSCQLCRVRLICVGDEARAFRPRGRPSRLRLHPGPRPVPAISPEQAPGAKAVAQQAVPKHSPPAPLPVRAPAQTLSAWTAVPPEQQNFGSSLDYGRAYCEYFAKKLAWAKSVGRGQADLVDIERRFAEWRDCVSRLEQARRAAR